MSDESMFDTFDSVDDAENQGTAGTEATNNNTDSTGNTDAEPVPVPIDVSGLGNDNDETTQPATPVKNESQSQPVNPQPSYSTAGFGQADQESDDSAGETQTTENEPATDGGSDGQQTFSTEKKDNQESFMSFSDAMKQKGGSNGKKPEKLNKPLITGIVAAVFVLTMIILVWRPDLKFKKKKASSGKPVAESALYYDLELGAKDSENPEVIKQQAAKKNEKNAENNTGSAGDVNPKYSNANDPINNRTVQDPYAAGAAAGSSSAGNSQAYVSDRPNTQNDSLHGKTINGIKGITSTQNSYITDYELQKMANTTVDAKTTASYAKSGSGSSLGNPNEYVDKLLKSTQGTSSYSSQNNQADKNSFMNSFSGTGTGSAWLGVNTVWQGTIFEATLTSEINTDLPGEVTARISKNIYSSQDGRYLLIPQNSILLGTYNSNITYNQRRVQVVWTTLIRPDGYQINLGGMNASDAKGASGVTGLINDHPGAYLKAIMLMSVVNIINSEYQSAIDNTTNQYAQNVAANAQQVTNELSQKLLDRAMDIQPTIKIKSGTKLNIVVNQNLTIPVVEKVPVTEKYQRGRLPKELY